jgi:ABC-2 type transport system ATP-binding protein
MNAGTGIRVTSLVKRFGSVNALRGVSFSAEPGRVTGFLGPNGAGKSTTLRILLGLTRADSGQAHIGGRPYRDLPSPTSAVGAVLDLASAHPGMSARGHLSTQAELGGHPRARVADVIDLTGMSDYAGRRIRGFSTGMRQRLSLATALLGDPSVLVLDEPSNGLDPAGIVWLRQFLRAFAAQGGTVLISSHVLTEVQHSIDDVVLVDRGRVSFSGTLRDVTAQYDSLEAAFIDLTAQGKSV